MDTILQHWGLIDHHLDGILLSAGLIALFTSPRSDGRHRAMATSEAASSTSSSA